MRFLFILIGIILISCSSNHYDYLIKNGTIVDGSGNPRFKSDLAIRGDKIVAIKPTIRATAKHVINAKGLIVSPGFIDMLSWACGPVLYDGHVPSVVEQGITTAIFGEGWSMGPLNNNVREALRHWWQEYHIQYNWNTLYDYLKLVERKGTAVNVASYVGATSLRLYVIGFDDRPATKAEMEKMKALLRNEMEHGALGLASSLVYAPAFYASTEELIELAKVAAEYGGVYASHIRSEGDELIKGLNEFIRICKEARIHGEWYHAKAAGQNNWNKLDSAIALVQKAQQEGVDITADIYPYTAAATGLSAMIPPWAKEGGDSGLVERLKNPRIRHKIKQEILYKNKGWENFYNLSGGGKNILFSYLSPQNKKYQGWTLAAYAQSQKKDEPDALMDLLISEQGGGGGIYFLMSEANIRKKMRLPYVSFCTDEDAYRPTGLMSQRHPHPRAYGTFPRVLGKYVRDEKVISLEEAVRKASALPASVLGLNKRGLLKPGYAADLVVFNADSITDRATYLKPHQYPAGIHLVMVNGKVVVKNRKLTGALPGKALFKKVRKK